MSAFVETEQLYKILDPRTVEILDRRRRARSVRRRGWLVRRALFAADIGGLIAAFVIAQLVYGARVGHVGALDRSTEFLAFFFSLPAWIVAFKLYGLYEKDEERADHTTADDAIRLFHVLTVCTFFLFALTHFTNVIEPVFTKLFLFWALAIVGTVCFRAAARTLCRRRLTYLQNTIIIGAGETGQELARKLLSHAEYGLNLVGFVDSNPRDRDERLFHLAVLGGLENLEELVALLDVERVIVAFTDDHHEKLRDALSQLRGRDVQIDIVPRLYDNLGPSVGIHSVEGIPLISLPPRNLSRSSLFVKRSLDIAVSAGVLLFMLPVIAGVAVLVAIDSRGPIFYRHQRVGKKGKQFQLVKFRTMYVEMCRGDAYGGDLAEQLFAELLDDPIRQAEFDNTFKLREDPRVTRVGRFLRRTSLDELPQLWNVLRGDISLVGPRALTSEELARYYGDAATDLLAIRPGVTGYWQINGRSHLEYRDRVRLDMAYIGGWSLGLDLLILARTIRVVFGLRSAY